MKKQLIRSMVILIVIAIFIAIFNEKITDLWLSFKIFMENLPFRFQWKY